MNNIDMQIQWQDGIGESVEIGYFNPNGQQCCGHCGVPGTDHGQYAYKTESDYHSFSANVSRRYGIGGVRTAM